MQEEFSGLGEAIIIALYLVFMVMAIQFGSIVYALLIMLCIPFAGIGSILLMLIMRVKVSITSLMGVLMLAGIVVNNGIIFIDTANQFRDEGEEIAEALVHAGRDRMRPIFMTTLTTELAMLPTAFKLAKDSEVMQGMAVVIVGGLFASTILTLILLPTFYMIVDKLRRNKPKKAAIYAREPEAPLFAEGEKEEYAVPEMAAQPAEGPCPGPEDDPAEEPAEFLPEEDAAEETGIGPAEIPEEVAPDDSEEKPESGIEIEDID
jgi:HAE1 family hydrophobic/amphiphilic exporter-1